MRHLPSRRESDRGLPLASVQQTALGPCRSFSRRTEGSSQGAGCPFGKDTSCDSLVRRDKDNAVPQTLLIVDDDPDLVQPTSDCFTAAGYLVVNASNGIG